MSDLISRQDAIDECDKQYPNIDRQDFKAVINAVPSADRPTVDKEYLIDLIQEAVYDGEACAKLIDLVDRPTGKWVRKYDKQINCYWYECNQCGEYRPRNVIGKEWSSPYCPKCGAKMYKGGDDE